jgi:hypothetical protein
MNNPNFIYNSDKYTLIGGDIVRFVFLDDKHGNLTQCQV